MRREATLALILAVAAAGANGAYEPCGSLENAYGPYDYRTKQKELAIVDRHHFTANVESLRSGQSGRIGGDIDYTLRASPNHHRALMAMVNLTFKEKTERPAGANYSINCYFDRALRFAADDGTVRMIYGTFLFKKGKKQEAMAQLEQAQELAGDNPNLNYNLGLVYLDLKDFDKALKHAHAAYRGGFQLPGLKNKLVAAGKWKEPPPEQSPPAENAARDEAAPAEAPAAARP